jgi:hypothetical protein
MTTRIKARAGRFKMRDGRIAVVHGKDRDPHPYPWVGVVPDQPDDDGWDSQGRNWKTPALDLIEPAPTE